MKKQLLFYLLLSLNFVILPAQTIIATSDETFTGTDAIINFTIGEIAIHTYDKSITCITEGFNQSDISSTTTDVSENTTSETALESTLCLYPNPVTQYLYIQNKSTEDLWLTYSIIDISGETLLNGTFLNTIKIDDLSKLSPQIYIVNIYNEGKLIASEKIIKK